MNYTIEDMKLFLKEHDVQFIRLVFCDIFGNQKNISVRPYQIEDIIENGLVFQGGLSKNQKILLKPDLTSLDILPWRPQSGSVIRFFCQICDEKGNVLENDLRTLLQNQQDKIKQNGLDIKLQLGTSFYLLKKDQSLIVPHDEAGYLDVAPMDQGEDIRRQICLNLDDMAIQTSLSYHDYGPGQNSVDLTYQDVLTACDQFITLKWAIQTSADLYDLIASFGEFEEWHENTLHMRYYIHDEKTCQSFCEGICKYSQDICKFLNLSKEPLDCVLSNHCIEFISIRPTCQPYLVTYLFLMAGLYGIKKVQTKTFIQDILSSTLLESLAKKE